MKNIFVVIFSLSLVLFTGCKKDDDVITKPDAIETELIGKILSIKNEVTTIQMPAPVQQKRIGSNGVLGYEINQQIDFSQVGEAGGLVTVKGVMTGVLNEANTTLNVDMTEAFKDLGILIDGKTYTTNGNIAYKGNTQISNQEIISQFTLSGALLTSGEKYNKTSDMQLVVVESISGSSIKVTVSGRINGQNVSYSQNVNIE